MVKSTVEHVSASGLSFRVRRWGTGLWSIQCRTGKKWADFGFMGYYSPAEARTAMKAI
jgi:hypothetical protein